MGFKIDKAISKIEITRFIRICNIITLKKIFQFKLMFYYLYIDLNYYIFILEILVI
jgi:hypothetical protein